MGLELQMEGVPGLIWDIQRSFPSAKELIRVETIYEEGTWDLTDGFAHGNCPVLCKRSFPDTTVNGDDCSLSGIFPTRFGPVKVFLRDHSSSKVAIPLSSTRFFHSRQRSNIRRSRCRGRLRSVMPQDPSLDTMFCQSPFQKHFEYDVCCARTCRHMILHDLEYPRFLEHAELLDMFLEL